MNSILFDSSFVIGSIRNINYRLYEKKSPSSLLRVQYSYSGVENGKICLRLALSDLLVKEKSGPLISGPQDLNINYRLFIGIPRVRELGTYNDGNKLRAD